MQAKYIESQVALGIKAVLHLKLHEGTVFDYSLNSHSGILAGTTSYQYPGIDMVTDGVIAVADHADFTPAGTALSVSAWCYMDDATSFVIASKGVYNTDGEWRFMSGAADKMFFKVSDESVDNCNIGRIYDTAMTSVAQGKWSHWVATYDGGTVSADAVRIYLNGLRVDDADSEANAGAFVAVENLAGEVRVGRYDSTYSDGKIDDLIIYTKVLTAEEILSIYSITRHRYSV